MLQEVSGTIKRLRVKRTSNMNVKGGARFISLIVRDKDCSNLVWELNTFVLAFVTLRCDDLGVFWLAGAGHRQCFC